MGRDDDELRHFLRSNRRKDHATADLIEVGLMFMRVFGRDKGRVFFSGTVVEPEVYWRVIRKRSRGSAPDVDPEATGDVDPGPR